MGRRRLLEDVADALFASGLEPEALTLEITESSLLLEAPRTRSTIEELHELGVHLSIDDFGTGYSSLSYLRRLAVSELKVDQSFIANMLVDQQDEVIALAAGVIFVSITSRLLSSTLVLASASSVFAAEPELHRAVRDGALEGVVRKLLHRSPRTQHNRAPDMVKRQAMNGDEAKRHDPKPGRG